MIGSFLNVLIYRLEVGDSAFRGRSYCPHCKHALAWYDLIPLVSFVLLHRRCRYCKKSIAWQYPLVEASTAILFLLIFNHQSLIFDEFSSLLIFNLAYFWIVAASLIVLFVYDLKHYILPDKILIPIIGLALFYQIFIWILVWIPAPLVQSLLSALGAASFFFAVFAVSRGRAMGFGDVKLAAFMGLFLGWPNIFVALFAAFTLGGVVGTALILTKRKGMKSVVPFGPFLITGMFIALFWGKSIADWYWNVIY